MVVIVYSHSFFVFNLVLTLTKWCKSALTVIEINYHVSCFIFLMKLQAYTRLYADYMLNLTLKLF